MSRIAIHNLHQMNIPVDRNDPEGVNTAVEMHFPATFSKRAWKVIDYFEGTMFLYSYKGRYVVTDESLYLTESGDGTSEAPIGGPRWTGDTLEELELWLLEIADEYDADPETFPGWEVDDE